MSITNRTPVTVVARKKLPSVASLLALRCSNVSPLGTPGRAPRQGSASDTPVSAYAIPTGKEEAGRSTRQRVLSKLRFAYADPPYPGQAKRHYGCAEVDYIRLLDDLKLYDGWALSTSSSALSGVLFICPKQVRIAAWVKPFAIFKPNVNPAYAWEPVIFMGGRKRTREEPTVRDWHSENITLRKGLCGAKPPGFAIWIANLLGAAAGDSIDDLFPGTGGCGKEWDDLGIGGKR